MANPPQSYGVSPAIWDHKVLPDTGERGPTPPMKPVLDLPTPDGWKAELTWVVGCIPQTVTHPSSNNLVATRLGS